MKENKIYWKKGFYDTPQESAVIIEVENWISLLEGQSVGKIIIENEKGFPILNEPLLTLEEVRRCKLNELRAYDNSEAINQFFIKNVSGWLNKRTRIGLINSIAVEKEAGLEETTIWLGDNLFVFSIEKAINMLHRIELYALACYKTTQEHIRAINQLETIEEIEAYDFRAGYPSKLNFAG